MHWWYQEEMQDECRNREKKLCMCWWRLKKHLDNTIIRKFIK